MELEDGIPLFLDQLAHALRSKAADSTLTDAASMHGGEMLRSGFTVAQVVNDDAGACQTRGKISARKSSVEIFAPCSIASSVICSGEWRRVPAIDVDKA